ncbi:hypothetical protein AAC387_Pa04g2246 [Persea americana]
MRIENCKPRTRFICSPPLIIGVTLIGAFSCIYLFESNLFGTQSHRIAFSWPALLIRVQKEEIECHETRGATHSPYQPSKCHARLNYRPEPVREHRVECGIEKPYGDLQPLLFFRVLRQFLEHTYTGEEDQKKHRERYGKSNLPDVFTHSYKGTDRIE